MSSFWLLSTPIAYLPASFAAGKIELQIPPPHEKIASVPASYHLAALVLIAGSSLNVPVYVYIISTVTPNSFAASFAP